jgi:hypothetical protein
VEESSVHGLCGFYTVIVYWQLRNSKVIAADGVSSFTGIAIYQVHQQRKIQMRGYKYLFFNFNNAAKEDIHSRQKSILC